MNSARKSQLKEILLQLTALRNDLNMLHWEIGEDIPINKSIPITRATKSLNQAINDLKEAI